MTRNVRAVEEKEKRRRRRRKIRGGCGG